MEVSCKRAQRGIPNSTYDAHRQLPVIANMRIRFSSPSCRELSVLQVSISVSSLGTTTRNGHPIDPQTGRKPTSSTSEAKVNVAAGSMPWQTEGDEAREAYKYKYYPRKLVRRAYKTLFRTSTDFLITEGDPRNPPKEAPSALHSVIVPNVNLPKVRITTRNLPDPISWHYVQLWGKSGSPLGLLHGK